MSKLRVHNFAISLDGYGAGPRQGLEHGLGVGGEELHGWYVGTRAFREMHGQTGGTTGPDNDFAKRFGERIGACARALARRPVARLVGREPVVSRAGVRADEPRARTDHDERRDRLSFRHRRN